MPIHRISADIRVVIKKLKNGEKFNMPKMGIYRGV